jgi:hypothetical protein
MVKINPINVAKLLFDDISAKYTKVTPINAKEIELKDQLLGKKCILFIVYKALAAIYGVLQTKNFSLNCLSMAYLNLLNTKSKGKKIENPDSNPKPVIWKAHTLTT